MHTPLPANGLPPQLLVTRTHQGQGQVWCLGRRRWVSLTPEEHVRQSLLHWLLHTVGAPRTHIAVERGLQVGTRTKRFDVAVWAPNSPAPWLLAECKAPAVPLSPAVWLQALGYNSAFGARHLLLTNGPQLAAWRLGPAGYEAVQSLEW